MAAIEDARALIDEMREQLTECEDDAKNLLIEDLHEDAKLLADAAVELADLAGRLVEAWQARPAGGQVNRPVNHPVFHPVKRPVNRSGKTSGISSGKPANGRRK